MAEHEDLVARLRSIAQDATKLDSRARQEVLDATISCSAKLLAQPSTDQSDALNEPQVQPIPLLPFQTDDMDMSADDHETPTGDHCGADFGQLSTGLCCHLLYPSTSAKRPIKIPWAHTTISNTYRIPIVKIS